MIDVVMNRKRHLGIAAVDGTRRGIDEVLDLRMPAAFQNVQKPFDVAVRIGMRVHQRIAHTACAARWTTRRIGCFANSFFILARLARSSFRE